MSYQHKELGARATGSFAMSYQHNELGANEREKIGRKKVNKKKKPTIIKTCYSLKPQSQK